MTLTQMSELFMEELRSTKKFQEEMAQAKAEADARYEAEMAELERLFPDVEEEEPPLTVEDVEISLASIDSYRGQIIDISITNESEWINSNIKASDILGAKYKRYDNENVIDVLSSILKMTPTKVKLLIRKGLGIKKGSEYQNNQRAYVDELVVDFEDGMYDTLTNYLKKVKLYDFYAGLLEYARRYVSIEALGANKDELVFFVCYTKLKATLKNRGMKSGLGTSSLRDKLKILCLLGLLRNLPDDCINPKYLEVANELKDKASKEVSKNARKDVELNRRNFYVLNDLSPQTQHKALKRIQIINESGLRRKDIDATSLALLFGVEEVEDNIVVQKEAKVIGARERLFLEVAQELLATQGYYTEEDLRKGFSKRNHSYSKKDAEAITRHYLAGTTDKVGAIKTRVKNEIKEKYELPAKIKSNSYIYIVK